MVQRNQEHERGASLHHHDKHAAHKDGHRPDDPHGVTAWSSPDAGNACDVCGVKMTSENTPQSLTDKCGNCNEIERGY